ncbi:hypothetical protein PAXRUDRAFT_827099 [Paxillus rubicundulus Ve08.2h10]|uniref:Uncharacterized protein n=1 Tax=Paxillus rubicundulus Ve08.2h10 TaxID=930991 RepID=A0A0D0DYN3_9AGAM|nr:hypothetical protein PAXRUDRAFT_827099 [Paxillus rubicundulus Ve08.2h10]
MGRTPQIGQLPSTTLPLHRATDLNGNGIRRTLTRHFTTARQQKIVFLPCRCCGT